MTSKVKTFFHVLVNSLLPAKAYYQKIPHTRYLFSIKYFVFLTVVLNFLLMSFVIVKMNPFRIERVTQSLLAELERYPKDLTISVSNGKMFTNSYRPYFLWLDYEGKKHLLLVVDQDAEPDQIVDYNSSFLLNSAGIVFRNNSTGKIGTISYPFDERITVSTVKRIESIIIKLTTVLLLLYPAFVILSFLFLTVLSLLVTTLYMLLATVIVFLLLKLFKKRNYLPAVKIFHVSLHAVTLPLLLNYVLTFFRITAIPLPYLFIALTVFFTYLGVYETYPKHSS